ncbi:ABC transporter permease [Mesorhizobium sp. ZC-5]|uniref:ABC transporter permease n=1 Tax=Mesorhizobium sp. ZC-5 TaxID=2986066 RepID=UPI0021E85E7F|nr:ABC transporter permease [Mesorhizobium sp. ZC-5]MCV3240727.1 ABC transporter permease [Mesorhizobium sp. ZC-5]
MADAVVTSPLAPATSRIRNRTIRRFLTHRPAVVGLCILVFVALVAIFAPIVAPYDPIKSDFSAIRQGPSALHWMGTDELGRDLLSRLIYGARTSLMAGVLPVSLALIISIPLGLLSGYVGGFLDTVLMRITDALLAIPFLVLAIALTAVLGPGLYNAMLAIGVAAIPVFLRLSRGSALAVSKEDYIEAARAGGNSSLRIAFKHVLPNMIPPLFVQATLTVATAIIVEASLSFLGLGQRPPAPSWGSMLNESQRFLTTMPLMSLWPGLAIFMVVMSINIVGDGIRDAMDPRHKS